ncbi:hypothetical protein psal_cds_1414 [Pandoravirus salinus]|uniref:Uncharacterized protein n=1 Tax=Pandoravirus salinus TaxID=1349410 RepID=S4VYR9_9VIRU|nr:hypothetical protein psal_cds_1414 [Pandoravirus salinus]AGO85849.1 hypothetical protein psal_cds_1414 [Pandoravirus salinus]
MCTHSATATIRGRRLDNKETAGDYRHQRKDNKKRETKKRRHRPKKQDAFSCPDLSRFFDSQMPGFILVFS